MAISFFSGYFLSTHYLQNTLLHITYILLSFLKQYLSRRIVNKNTFCILKYFKIQQEPILGSFWWLYYFQYK